MTTQVKTTVIDADAHVIETEHTWDYLDPSERKFRPVLAVPRDSDGATGRFGKREYWVIDGKICGFRFPTLTEQQMGDTSKRIGRNVATPEGAREVENVDIRLRHMDALGIDVQVLYHTLFISPVTDRPEVDVAISGAWNRWMADVYKLGKGRLYWICVPPYLSIPDAIDQIREAKKNGAVGVSMRPVEGSRFLVDPYFYPIYEEAERLNMPMALHISNGSPQLIDIMRSPYDQGSAFGLFRTPNVVACHALMLSEIPQRFPNLRWGFIECAAQWVPWVIQEAKSRAPGFGRTIPENTLEAFKIWVTLQTDDDINYLVKRCGETNFMIGTDYGHTDPSSNVDAILEFSEMDDVSPEVKERILTVNPKAFYNL